MRGTIVLLVCKVPGWGWPLGHVRLLKGGSHGPGTTVAVHL